MGGNNDITYEWHFIRASVGTPADARFVPEFGVVCEADISLFPMYVYATAAAWTRRGAFGKD